MTIDEVKKIFEFLADKYQAGYISGDDFNILFNQCSRDYYEMLSGQVEQYQYGRPVARIGIEQTAQVMEKLSPFTVTSPLTITSGQATKPTDLYKILSYRRSSDNKNIERCKHGTIDARLNSAIDSPSDKPFYIEIGNVLYVYPTSTTSSIITYLKTMPDVVWGYTVVSNREVYNPGSSTDPLWKDQDISAIIGRMLKGFGVSIKDADLFNYGNQVINAGE